MPDRNTANQELQRTLSNTHQLVGNVPLHLTVGFIHHQDLWNDYGIYGPLRNRPRKNFSSYRFKPGDVLKIDFGHLNFGRELSFFHMAIVLGNFKDLVVVAPITSDRQQSYTPETANAILPMKAADFLFLHHNSLLLLHQIRVISKNRIEEVMGHSVSKTPFLEEIHHKLQQLYTPHVRKQTNERIHALEQQVRELKLQLCSQLAQAQAAPTSER